MATQTGSIDLKAAKKAHDDAEKKATNFITEIGNSGIAVHDENDANNYIKIDGDSIDIYQEDSGEAVKVAEFDADGVDVFKNGVSVSSFGETVRIGKDGNSRVVIDDLKTRFYTHAMTMAGGLYMNEQTQAKQMSTSLSVDDSETVATIAIPSDASVTSGRPIVLNVSGNITRNENTQTGYNGRGTFTLSNFNLTDSASYTFVTVNTSDGKQAELALTIRNDYRYEGGEWISDGYKVEICFVDYEGSGEGMVYIQDNTVHSGKITATLSASLTYYGAVEGEKWFFGETDSEALAEAPVKATTFFNEPIIHIGKYYDATSSTSASTAKKKFVPEDEDYEIRVGVYLRVKFTYALTTSSVSLYANGESSSNAIPVYNNGAAASASNGNWSSGETVIFRYDGEHWNIVHAGDDIDNDLHEAILALG